MLLRKVAESEAIVGGKAALGFESHCGKFGFFFQFGQVRFERSHFFLLFDLLFELCFNLAQRKDFLFPALHLEGF
jgi:hypothetical protein